MRFLTYLKERSPLPALSILSLGIGLSGMYYNGVFDWKILILSLIINNLIFILLRLCDERKDFEKDKVINPTRPLPRGLYTVEEFERLIAIHFALITLSVIYLGVLGYRLGAGVLLIATVFAWLMFKEFYISHSLDKSPIIYALTHQVITFFIFSWPAIVQNQMVLENQLFLGWLLVNFGASFNFEISRKLDPGLPALSNTYFQFYGAKKTAVFITLCLLASVIGSIYAGTYLIIIPFIILILLSLIPWIKSQDKFKTAFGLSALFSLVALWHPCFIWLFNLWSSK